MSRLFSRESRLLSVALATALGLALAACSSGSGGGSSGGSSTPPATPQPSSAPASSAAPTGGTGPTSGSAAIAAIKTNWAAFFNAKTPNSKRIGLLQDGTEFATLIKAQSKSPLAAQATSKVTAVSLTGTTQAAVTYSILLGGKPALSKQHGVAVYQDGTWKVGAVSFCGLLTLEQVSGLPSVCQG